MPHIQARSDSYKFFIRGLGAQQLYSMSHQASDWHRKRTPWTDWEFLAQRYLDASFTFWALAALSGGSTYRNNLQYLQLRANKAREEWLKAQSHEFRMMTPEGRLRFAQSQANEAHEKWLIMQRRRHQMEMAYW